MNEFQYIKELLKSEAPSTIARQVLQQTRSVRLLHATVGIMGEIAELVNAMDNKDSVNIREELCDILWYICVILDCDELYFSLEGVYKISVCQHNTKKYKFTNILITAGNLQDYIKKHVFYGKEIDVQILRGLFRLFLNAYFDVVQVNVYTLDILKASLLRKIQVRYAGSFSAEKAENRNLEKERQVIETTIVLGEYEGDADDE